ncbi:MAG: hydroxymethylpyrimidine/phosphomethylpyrimidine kinase [Bacteroidota bacterium]
MSRLRPNIMSIAGFDPSGGAGTLADCKTFEQLKVYGFAVLTANTVQDDRTVSQVNWFQLPAILQQIDVILDRFEVNYFKLGIVKDAEMLQTVVKHIRSRVPKAFITWDPVLRSTGGTTFFTDPVVSAEVLSLLDLITPNLPEFCEIFGDGFDPGQLPAKLMVFLKGGHNTVKLGTDTFYFDRKSFNFRPKAERITPKHGSGCVLASALTAHLALGFKPHQAALKSKRYIEQVLNSRPELLGYHKR